MTGARAIADSRDGSRPWLIAGAVCALAATSVLMLTDEARWLRLGIIAALWSALLGAFLATKYRKSAEHAWGSIADAQHIYELELEREITARREYELELEASTRRRVEHETQSEIQDLRTEVMALRDSLQQLLEGDVVYERVALTEQSTRRRSMREEQNDVASGEDGSGPRLVSGTTTALEEVADQRTQVISRVVTSSAPGLRRARPPVVDDPQYEQYPQEPRHAPAYDAFPPEPEQPEFYEPSPPAEQAQGRYYRAELPTGRRPDDELSLPDHQSASEFSLADYTGGSSNGAAGGDARKYEFPAFSFFEEDAQESFDAFSDNRHGASANGNGPGPAFNGTWAGDGAFAANGHAGNGRHQSPPPQPPKRGHNDGSDTGDLSALIAANRANYGADQPGNRASHAANEPGSPAADHRGQWAQPQPQRQPPPPPPPRPAQQEHSWFAPAAPVASQENGHAGGAHRDPEPAANSSLPPGALEIQRQGRPGGRRRKPEPDEADAAMAPAGPSEPVVPETPTVRAAPSGQDDYSFPGVNGGHGDYQSDSAPFRQRASAGQPSAPQAMPSSPSRAEPGPRAPMQEEASGSHASGRSVHDLLAAHGRSAPARRHRYKD